MIPRARRHLQAVPYQWEQFRRYWEETEAIGAWPFILKVEVAALVASNPPQKLGTLDDMLRQAMDASGFCCEWAVDDFVAKSGGPDLVADLERQFPEFRPEWLTLAGAREYKDQRRQK